MKNEWLWNAKMVSWWLTWDDLKWPDPKLENKWLKRAQTFQEKGANTVVMFGFHFRWDYVSIIDRVLAILARISEICHDHGLRVVEHHSATLVHRARNTKDRWRIRERNNHHVPYYHDNWDNAIFEGQQMANWRQISARDAKPVYFENYNAEIFCPNNTEYQKAYLRLIEKHLENVKIDALMSDDLHFLPDLYSCSCQHCKSRFFHESGIKLPPLEDHSFWLDRANPALQKWAQMRYDSNVDHYRRLRNFLPDNIALWGCAASCTHPRGFDYGFKASSFAMYWDAVFYEVFHEEQLGKDDKLILSNIAAFASVARQLRIPLLSLFYVNRPEEVRPWLRTLSEAGSIPWLSKQVRIENAIPEEMLLRDGYDCPPAMNSLEGHKVAKIRFSQTDRDQLPPKLAEEYVEQYQQLCMKLLNQEFKLDVVLDEYANVQLPTSTNDQQQWTLVCNDKGQIKPVAQSPSCPTKKLKRIHTVP